VLVDPGANVASLRAFAAEIMPSLTEERAAAD